MKVLTEDGRWLDSTKDGIALVLSDTDKKNIAEMLDGCHVFCLYPVSWVAMRGILLTTAGRKLWDREQEEGNENS